MTDERKPRLRPGHISIQDAYAKLETPVAYSTFYTLCSLRLVPGCVKVVNRLCVREDEFNAAFIEDGLRSESWLVEALEAREAKRGRAKRYLEA